MEHDHSHDHPLLKFFDFTLARSAINSECAKRLQNIARTAKMQGFRPGKAPLSLIEKRYGEATANEVIEELAKQVVQEKMKNITEKLASRVSYHPSGGSAEALTFHAHYEIFPEFELAINQIPRVKKPKVNIDETSIDQMIEWMCRIYGEDGEAHEIERADRVTMSFTMMSEQGETLLQIDPYQFVVPLYNPSKYIDFPAESLLGKKVGDQLEWHHRYADDFANPLIAGQTIVLRAHIQTIQRKTPLSVETLFERLGLKDKSTEERRAEIRKQIDTQVARRINTTLTTRIGKALQAAHATLEVPPTMLEAELGQQGERVRADPNALAQSSNPREQALLKRLQTEAQQALQTQIVWLKIGEKIGKVERADVEQTLRAQCEDYENSEAVYQSLLKNRDAIESAYSATQQKKMMEWLTPQINIEEEEVAFAEFMIG